jgi:CDP-6-deoxy-D-xylo-4-hexulose-3-dehydrase
MKNIEDHILDLINVLGEDHNILRYVYNNNKKFIGGVTPVYYSGPYWDNKEIIAMIKVIISGEWLSSGENVQIFENAFVNKINNKFGVMVNSGSSANLVMMATVKKVLGWNDGDEIITSVVGFPTTIAPITQNKLTPVFVDIEMNSLNFDLDLIEEKITEKTRAIILSPVLGSPPDVDRLLDICKRHNLELLLDNCDSLGTRWKGKYLNEYALISTNSFYPSHHISTGEGGMVVSDNKAMIRTARSISWWGRDCFCVGSQNLFPNGVCGNRFNKWLKGYDGVIDHKYLFVNEGYNLKPLDLQGAVGNIQLEKFDEIHEKRLINKEILGGLFKKYLDVHIPTNLEDAEVSWFGTPIVCKSVEEKQKLVTYLEKKKIQTRNYFAGNILLHPGYKKLDDFRKYPEANKVLDLVFFIGASPHYNQDVFDYVESVLKEYVK